jgi:D-alanine-D-alanine ligase
LGDEQAAAVRLDEADSSPNVFQATRFRDPLIHALSNGQSVHPLAANSRHLLVGLTYDLRSEYLAAGYGAEETAEFDRDETIDSLAGTLAGLGYTVERIGNARSLIERLAAGERWDLVFNICEGLWGYGREAQVPTILDVYSIPYTFSDPLTLSLCLHKGLAKTVVRQEGLPTCDFRVAQKPADLENLGLPYPLFVKPIAEGTSKGVTLASRVWDELSLREASQSLWAKFGQPVIVEEFLPGREFTVGIIGNGGHAQVLGTMEILLRPEAEDGIYSYWNKEHYEDLVEYRMVSSEDDPEVARAEQIALGAWSALNCRDAGRIDLRSNAQGEPQFIEANPLAGLHPVHSDLPMLATARGVPYHELVDLIVQSALQRVLPYAHSHSA